MSVQINPEVVVWARNRLEATTAQVADSVGVEQGVVESWEADDTEPSFRQAQVLARVLKIPFGYLFLSEKPTDEIPLPDLRTVQGARPSDSSPDLLDTVNDLLRKQHWYSEFLAEGGGSALPFVGKFTTQDSIETVADDIRTTLEIDDDLRRQCASWGEFLTTIVRLAEMSGILVMRSGTVAGNTRRPLSVAEFRGFAAIDTLAPAIFINSKDAKVAQIFTLAHELAHIWIGESGISNPDFKKTSAQQVNQIERFCNRVAAEVLVPSSGFRKNWNTTATPQFNVAKLSAFYRVSRFVILRQALDLQVMKLNEYLRLLKEEYEKYIKRKEGSGGNYYNSLFARNSYKLTATITAAVAGGSVLYSEAARLLGVRTPVLDKLGAIL